MCTALEGVEEAQNASERLQFFERQERFAWHRKHFKHIRFRYFFCKKIMLGSRLENNCLKFVDKEVVNKSRNLSILSKIEEEPE